MLKSSLFLLSLCALALPGAAAPPEKTAAASAMDELPSRVDAASRTAPLPIDAGAKGLAQLLRKLRTRASLMTIVAHPDDEDGGMLTYESRGMGARVGLMTLTRGEGGQNVMSADAWDELGLVRTEELLAADRYYGADQFWGTEVDFGFSKTLEEAMQQWGHDRVLRDVVRAVRMYRPLVLTATFIGAPTDGHGHHQVSGAIAQEAFVAAGDAKVFPEQVREGLLPWQPLKMYARVPTFSITEKGMYDYATQKWAPVRFHDYVNGRTIEGTPATNVVVPEGTSDAVLGASYVQVAYEGLRQQRSQIPATVQAPSGARDVPYHRFGAKIAVKDSETSFFDGIDTGLAGIASLAPAEQGFLRQGLESLQRIADGAQAKFDAAAPEKTAPALREGLMAVNQLAARIAASTLPADQKRAVMYELGVKQQQFNDALVLALGVSVEARANLKTALVTPGESTLVRAMQSAKPEARLTHVELQAEDGAEMNRAINPAISPAGANTWQVKVPAGAKPTIPYFHRPNIEQPFYDSDQPALAGRSRTPYPLVAHFRFEYQGVEFSVERVVQSDGPEPQPLVIAPIAAIELSPAIYYVASPARPFTVTALVSSPASVDGQSSTRLKMPRGWSAVPEQAEFKASASAGLQMQKFLVTPGQVDAREYPISGEVMARGQRLTASFRAVGYPGLRTSYESRPAVARAVGVDVRVAPHLTVGYVQGTGDNVPEAIANLGAEVHLLTDEELKTADLAKYSTIVLGIRAYAARQVLPQVNTRLLEYVKNGGTLVVQYNASQYDHNFGPYPYSLTSDPARVVEERAPVKIVEPQLPLLNQPNHITAGDFDHWVEERGHSFMKSWDAHYSAPTETHDTDQDPQRGGLLVAEYGKGTYIYVAYALYRQLDEGVPGAYRLLANLISAKPAGTASAAR